MAAGGGAAQQAMCDVNDEAVGDVNDVAPPPSQSESELIWLALPASRFCCPGLLPSCPLPPGCTSHFRCPPHLRLAVRRTSWCTAGTREARWCSKCRRTGRPADRLQLEQLGQRSWPGCSYDFCRGAELQGGLGSGAHGSWPATTNGCSVVHSNISGIPTAAEIFPHP